MSDRDRIDLLYQISRTLLSRQIRAYNPNLINIFGWDLAVLKMWSRRHIMEDRALLVMLLTGCRVSEVSTIKMLKIKDEIVIIIKCKKQHKDRVMHIGAESILTGLIPITLANATMEVSQKQLSRYLHKHYPDILPGKDFNGHKACHVLRYMYIAILAECFDLSYSEIRSIMCWSEDEMVETYLEYLKYMRASCIKTDLTKNQ